MSGDYYLNTIRYADDVALTEEYQDYMLQL